MNIEQFHNILPEKFILKSERFSKQKDRFFYLMGRLLVSFSYKHLYKKEINWELVEFPLEFGKPSYAGEFKFNISHSGNIVGCVSTFGEMEVGLDIQQMGIIHNLDYQSVLNNIEYQYVMDSDNIAKTFYKYWVLKEAVLKLSGEGFLEGIDGFDFINFHENNVHILYKGNQVYTKKINFMRNKDHLGYVASKSKDMNIEIHELNLNDLM